MCTQAVPRQNLAPSRLVLGNRPWIPTTWCYPRFIRHGEIRRLGHERQTGHEYEEQPVIAIKEERERNLPHKSDVPLIL